MAALAQIIVIITLVYLADCRLRVGFHKHIPLIKNQRIQENNSSDKNSSADQFHQTAEKEANVEGNILVKDLKVVKDADAIVFPSDVDTKIYGDMNKIDAEDQKVIDNDKHNNNDHGTANVNEEVAVVPLISKVVPAVEAKEVFTNPIVLEITENVNFKEDKENTPTTVKPAQELAEVTVANDINITLSSLNITLDDIKELQIINDTSSSNGTVPDFQNRFGVTGDYMLVPVNNVQTYQPIPMIQNVPPQHTTNGSPNPYVANNDQASAALANVGANTQYVTPNIGSNVGTYPQYTENANAGLNFYATPVNTQPINYNGNVAQGNNYVPINVPNTYMINGQLYAAVTIPNNVNVPNSLYFVNPQLSGYQVANNMPLYRLVSVGSQVGGQVGGQMNNVNNGQYVLQ